MSTLENGNELSTDTNRLSGRERFINNLPQRQPVVQIASNNPEQIKEFLSEVIRTPEDFFRLMRFVSPEDCLVLFQTRNHFRLWEAIGNATTFRAYRISQAALESVGPENIKDLASSLVFFEPESGKTVPEVKMRALSGIKLASSLSIGDIEGVFAEYSNIARVDNSAFDTSLLHFLSVGVDSFTQSLLNKESCTNSVLSSSARIIEDLKVFATKEREWYTSDDKKYKRFVGQMMVISRRKVVEDIGECDLTNQMDELLSLLGYKFDLKTDCYQLE